MNTANFYLCSLCTSSLYCAFQAILVNRVNADEAHSYGLVSKPDLVTGLARETICGRQRALDE